MFNHPPPPLHNRYDRAQRAKPVWSVPRKIFPMLLVLYVWLASFGWNSAAQAGLITPSGNPTGPGSADSPIIGGTSYIVSLFPANAYLATGSSWLAPALGAQGIDAAHGWTINYFMLAGDFRLDTYEAWAETKPAVVEPTINVSAVAKNGYGGAALGLHYTGADGQHWIQVIRTNNVLQGVVGYNSPSDPGFTWYIDDVGNPAGDPFYDTIGVANATDFIDRPNRLYDGSTVWEAQAFIATVNNQTLNIGEPGVQWGFSDPIAVPEPSTFALAFSSGLVLLLRRGMRRRA